MKKGLGIIEYILLCGMAILVVGFGIGMYELIFKSGQAPIVIEQKANSGLYKFDSKNGVGYYASYNDKTSRLEIWIKLGDEQ